MWTEAMPYQEGKVIDYTPGSAVAAGQVLQVNGRAAIAMAAIAANVKGSIMVEGIIEVQAAAVAGNAENVVGWDENGSPLDGTASSGAAVVSLPVADFILGSLVKALATTAGRAYVALNKFSDSQPAWSQWTHELLTDDLTIDAEDHGKVLHIATDAKAFTLPATAAGLEVIIVNDGIDGNNIVTINPNSNDKIMGPNIAGTDNKDQVNTKTTAIRGDFMHLRADGSNGWWIMASRGIWAEES